jgi:hypothetical protein
MTRRYGRPSGIASTKSTVRTGRQASATQVARVRLRLDPHHPGYPHVSGWRPRCQPGVLPMPASPRSTSTPLSSSRTAALACWTGESGDAAGARNQYAALLPVLEQVFGAGHPRNHGRAYRTRPLDPRGRRIGTGHVIREVGFVHNCACPGPGPWSQSDSRAPLLPRPDVRLRAHVGGERGLSSARGRRPKHCDGIPAIQPGATPITCRQAQLALRARGQEMR